jgi:hypothetical protein
LVLDKLSFFDKIFLDKLTDSAYDKYISKNAGDEDLEKEKEFIKTDEGQERAKAHPEEARAASFYTKTFLLNNTHYFGCEDVLVPKGEFIFKYGETSTHITSTRPGLFVSIMIYYEIIVHPLLLCH